jgi:hypothetical protein
MRWRILRTLGAAALLFAANAAGQAAAAERLLVGPDGAPLSLQQALAAARDGDTIELLPGEYSTGQHLLIENRRLTLRGVGKRPLIKGSGKPGQWRALWIVRGGDVTIENIEFRGARATDTDGAGLRQEGGRLTIIGAAFYDNEHGIVALNDPAAEIEVRRSLFGLAPKVEGGLHHLLSVGRIGKLTITGSRFQQGFEGHMIKSRARENLIAYNFIHDGLRGGASYEIDLPAGGLATVVGNVIGQGSESQNRVMVAYGSEGQTWDVNKLHLAHNTFINYKGTPAWFLRVWKDRLGADTEVVAINNLLVGPGFFWLGAPGRFEGNRPATLGMLRDAETYAFELPPESVWRHSGIDPRNVAGRNLAPQAEFEWPEGVRTLPPQRSSWAPGAYQR